MIYMQHTHFSCLHNTLLHICACARTHANTCVPNHIYMQKRAHPHMYTRMPPHRMKTHIVAVSACSSSTLHRVRRGLCRLYPEPRGLCTVSLAPLRAHGWRYLCCSECRGPSVPSLYHGAEFKGWKGGAWGESGFVAPLLGILYLLHVS